VPAQTQRQGQGDPGLAGKLGQLSDGRFHDSMLLGGRVPAFEDQDASGKGPMNYQPLSSARHAGPWRGAWELVGTGGKGWEEGGKAAAQGVWCGGLGRWWVAWAVIWPSP